MKISIRKEPNGIYTDKTALSRFSEETLKHPPYNFSFLEVPFEDFENSDFNEDLSFSTDKYNARKLKATNEPKIAELKQKLAETDYRAIKFSEGQLSAEDYAKTKAQRQVWRDEINSLEVE